MVGIKAEVQTCITKGRWKTPVLFTSERDNARIPCKSTPNTWTSCIIATLGVIPLRIIHDFFEVWRAIAGPLIYEREELAFRGREKTAMSLEPIVDESQ